MEDLFSDSKSNSKACKFAVQPRSSACEDCWTAVLASIRCAIRHQLVIRRSHKP